MTVLDTLERQIREEIARLGGNQQLDNVIDFLHIDHVKPV